MITNQTWGKAAAFGIANVQCVITEKGKYEGNRNAADLLKKCHPNSLCGWKLLQDGHQCLGCLLGLLREQSVHFESQCSCCAGTQSPPTAKATMAAQFWEN